MVQEKQNRELNRSPKHGFTQRIRNKCFDLETSYRECET